MSTMDEVKRVVDKYWADDEIICSARVILDQASNVKPDCQNLVHIDLNSNFGKFLCEILKEKLAEYEKVDRAKAAMSKCRLILADGSDKYEVKTEPISSYLECKLNDIDLSPYLQYAAKYISRRLSSVISYLNYSFELLPLDLPRDETAFGNYLLKHYQISIDFCDMGSDMEAYISEDCINDIKKVK